MNENILKTQDIFIEYCTMLSEIFGLSEAMAQIIGYIYLSPHPVSIPDICKRLDLTKGTVSLYLRSFEDRKIIQRAWVKKKGREKYYEINPNLWEDLRKAFVNNAKKRIQITEEAVTNCITTINEDRDDFDNEDRLIANLIIERLQKISDLNDLTKVFLNKNMGLIEELSADKPAKKINIKD